MITVTDECIADIPALHITDSAVSEEPLPAVIFWHGFLSGKEHNLHFAYNLAKNGVRVIMPEAAHHGERHEGLTEKQMLLQFWTIVLQSVNETAIIREELERQKLIDDKRLFIAGTSMGGIIACGVLAAYSWIKGASILMGSPSWESFARHQITVLEQQGALPLTEEETEKLIQKLIPYDLSQNQEVIADRPVFFWHGQDDDVVSYHESYEFYKEIKESQNDSTNIDYRLDPSAGHKVTRAGMLDMADWTLHHI
ncbi:esterase [Alteribacillus sp. HJP-4]|uniref:esterase n=1 Tax=Alteribacillus sp. HJP-4 TaxID=2775394 RepID=UPI0035CD076B